MALAAVALGRQQHPFLTKEGPEFLGQRPRLCLTHGQPLGRCLAVDGSLDGEDLVNAAHRLHGDGRLGELGQVEQLTAAMAPARRLEDGRRLAPAVIEVVVARVGVGLHDGRRR